MSSPQKSLPQITPQYLIQISRIVQTLNTFYQQQQLGSISHQYKNMLTHTFTTLSQNIQIYSNSVDSGPITSASVLKCRAEIQMYCMEKLGVLLSKETQVLGNIMLAMVDMYRENIAEFQRVVIMERRKRIEACDGEKDNMIEKLRQELVYRKQYIAELKQRLADVQNENSKIYQKMIGNAKNASDRALSISPKKHNASIINPGLNSSIAKLKSQALLGTAHKTLSAKQVEQTIIDIMQTKLRQQTVKGKKVSLKNFLKTYFRYKFGMKELAEETQINFKEAIDFFSQTQEKNIFIMFLKIFVQECQEQFFWEQRTFYQKLIKVIKRYLNEKDGIHFDELQRIYSTKIIDERLDIRINQKDIQYILINTYKTSEVDSLQMILNQILIQKLQKSPQQPQNLSGGSSADDQFLVPSKKLINQILNYQLSRHLLKIEDIVRMVRDIDNGRGYLNQQDLQNVIVRLGIAVQKIDGWAEAISQFQGKFVTYSEAIQFTQKIRKAKAKKGNQRSK